MAHQDDMPVELMAGMPASMVQQTMYNGSKFCKLCGSLVDPTTAMYTGEMCPDCITDKSASRVQGMMGR